MVKVLKTKPYRMSVFPDGRAGGDRRAFTLLERQVSLGLGASSLAWHGRAATFFVGTRWRGVDAIEIYIGPGPVADASGDREAFDEAFHAF